MKVWTVQDWNQSRPIRKRLQLCANRVLEFVWIVSWSIYDCQIHFFQNVGCFLSSLLWSGFKHCTYKIPTADVSQYIMDRHAKPGFLGALRSLCCSSWKLSCFSVGKTRRSVEKSETAESRLESGCDESLWIWRIKFSFPSAMHDMNFMDYLPLYTDKWAEVWPPYIPHFEVGDKEFNWFRWMVDGINPWYQFFIWIILHLTTMGQPFSQSTRVLPEMCGERLRCFNQLVAYSTYSIEVMPPRWRDRHRQVLCNSVRHDCRISWRSGVNEN